MSDALDDDWPAPLVRPEAIDALLRRRPAPGARPSPPRTGGLPVQSVLAALVLIAAVWAATGFYKVEPDQVGIVLRFGRWVDTRSSGLNFHLPYPIETVLLPRVTQANQLKISNGAVTQTLTGDENIVEATAAVFWRIKDPAKYLFNVNNPDALVRIAGESAVRQVIGLNPIQAGLSDQRQKIADDAQARLQKLLDAYDIGIAVTRPAPAGRSADRCHRRLQRRAARPHGPGARATRPRPIAAATSCPAHAATPSGSSRSRKPIASRW